MQKNLSNNSLPLPRNR